MKCPCKRPPKLGDLSKGAAGQVMPSEGRRTTRRGERVPSSKLGFKAAASLARVTAKAAEGFKEAGNTVDHIVVRNFQNSVMANRDLFEKKTTCFQIMVQVDTTDKINYTWLRNKREMVSSESDLEIAIHNSTRLMVTGKSCKLSKGFLRTIFSF